MEETFGGPRHASGQCQVRCHRHQHRVPARKEFQLREEEHVDMCCPHSLSGHLSHVRPATGRPVLDSCPLSPTRILSAVDPVGSRFSPHSEATAAHRDRHHPALGRQRPPRDFSEEFPSFCPRCCPCASDGSPPAAQSGLLKHELAMRWPCPKHFRGHTPARSKSPRASQDCPHLAPLQPPSLLAVLQQGFLWEGAGGDGLPAQVPEPSSPSHLQHPLFRLEHRSPHPLVQV